MHQGQPLHRTQLQPRPRVDAAQARGRKGPGPLRAGGLGRGARRYRCTFESHCRTRPNLGAGHPALQLRRHHGPGAGRGHGRALLPQAWGQLAGPHHLQQRGRRSVDRHLRRAGRNACALLRREPADPDLGQQLHHLELAFLDLCAASQAGRRAAGVHRPAQDRDGRQVPPAHRPAARHGWRAGAGPDARTGGERLARPRLHRPPCRRLAGLARPRVAVAARARGGRVRHHGRRGAWPGARLRRDAAGCDPSELRHAAGAGRRQCCASDRFAALPDRRLAPPRRRLAAVGHGLVPQRTQRRLAAAARSARHAQAAHRQHEHDRRRPAARKLRRIRPAHRGRRGLQQQPRGGGTRKRQGRSRIRACRPVHGGARALPDRHRRPRRLRAARHHAARTLGRPPLIRPHLRHAERTGDCARGPGAVQRRHLPRPGRPHGLR